MINLHYNLKYMVDIQLVLLGIFVYFINKIYNYFSKISSINKLTLNKSIFIITSHGCQCKKNYKYFPFIKCTKCLIPSMIDFENINDVYRMLSHLNNKNCHLIIHTEGGESSCADLISRLLSEKKMYVKTYVPKYAQSAGTMMAICGNKIFMNWYSIMGPIDTQLDYDEDDTYSAKYIKNFKKKNWAKEKDYLRGLEADAVHNDDEFLLDKILANNPYKDKIINRLLNTKYSHSMSYTRDDIREMGLPVTNDVPHNITKIFNIFEALF